MQNPPLKQLQNSFILICEKTYQRLQLSLNLFESHHRVRSLSECCDRLWQSCCCCNLETKHKHKQSTTAVCLLRKTYFWYFKWTSCCWVWLDSLSSNWAPQGNLMFYMLSDKNVFRELLCQHWNFNSLFSPGNRRELLTHAVMFSGAVFHRKARASTDFYMWSSLNVGELQQCLQNLLLTLSNFTKGSIANCPHFVKFGWKENILLVFIRAQNSFWKPACLPCSERGFITIDSVPNVAKISSQSLCELPSDSGTAVWGPVLQTKLHFPLLFPLSQCLVPKFSPCAFSPANKI